MADADEISNVLDTLDDKRGFDQNGGSLSTAQVNGTIYVPNITGAAIAHAKERYPDITITYYHVTATLTYCDNDGVVLGTETITDGGAATDIPVLTTKEDERYIYTFLGWSREQGVRLMRTCLTLSSPTLQFTPYIIW